MNKLVVISIIVYLFGIECFAQTNLGYLYHKQYSNTNEWAGVARFDLEQDLKSGLYFSEILEGVHSQTAFDFSLRSDPEIYEISPMFEDSDTRLTLFRTHSESLETLREMLIFSNSGYNTIPSADFSSQYFSTTFRLQPGSHLINSWGLDIENQSEDIQKDLLILYDNDNNQIYKRELNYQLATGFASSLGDSFLRMENKLNDQIHIRDFRFADTVIKIVSADTSLIYYAGETLYQEVSNHDTILYSGVMNYSGYFKSLGWHVDGNSAFRVFTISGEVDLDVTDQEYVYTSISGSTDLILVKYSVDGHISFVKKLASYQSDDPINGDFYPILFVDSSQVAVRFSLSESYNISLSMDVYRETQVVDSGVVEGDIFPQVAKSPKYFSSLDKVSGEFLGITKCSFLAEDEGFSSRNTLPDMRLTRAGKVLVNVFSSSQFTENELIIESLYPGTFLYDLEPENSMLYCRFVELPAIPDSGAIPISTVFTYEAFPNNILVFENLLRINDELILLSGVLRNSVNLTVGDTLISLQNTPDPTFGVDGILLAVIDITVSNNEIERPKYSVFPNPTSEQLRIDLPYNGFLNYEIQSITGQQILNGKFSESRPIYVGALQPAIYLLVISDGRNTQTVKFVKE